MRCVRLDLNELTEDDIIRQNIFSLSLLPFTNSHLKITLILSTTQTTVLSFPSTFNLTTEQSTRYNKNTMIKKLK